MRAMFIQLSIAVLTLIVPEIWKDTFEGLRRSQYWRFIQIAVIIWIAVVVWIAVFPSVIYWANRNRSFAVIIASAIGAVIFGTAAWHWITPPSPVASANPETEKPNSPSPTPDKGAAVSPPTAMAVPGEIGWNFSSCLGMSGGGTPTPQVRVQSFQAFGRNTWSSTITKIEGYVEIDGTGERFPLLFSKEGTLVDLEQMPPIEVDERAAVACYFIKDRSLWGSWKGGIESNSFLNRYTPFTFVVSINGGKERKYPFSTEYCRALIQSMIDSISRSKN